MTKEEIINHIKAQHVKAMSDFKQDQSDYNLGKVGALQTLLELIDKQRDITDER